MKVKKFKKKKKKELKASLESGSPCLMVEGTPLEGPEETRPRRIFIYRTMKKWSIPQIAEALGLDEDVIASEYKEYAKKLALFHDPRKVELEVEFCEDQIRVLLEPLSDMMRIPSEERRSYSPQMVQLSKAIFLWEELLCRLRGYLLPTSIMQQLIEEKQKKLANLEQLSEDTQTQIFDALRKDRINRKESHRLGGFSLS